jgi:hypothetical protein
MLIQVLLCHRQIMQFDGFFTEYFRNKTLKDGDELFDKLQAAPVAFNNLKKRLGTVIP